jgi:membrane-bound inhibitor of C-type lysozyme
VSRILAFMLALVPAAAAPQQDAVALAIAYRCDDGTRLQLEYARDRSGRVVATSGSKRWTMTRQVAASGERYVDDQNKLEWWTKGRAGNLTQLASGKTVRCREQAPKNK